MKQNFRTAMMLSDFKFKNLIGVTNVENINYFNFYIETKENYPNLENQFIITIQDELFLSLIKRISLERGKVDLDGIALGEVLLEFTCDHLGSFDVDIENLAGIKDKYNHYLFKELYSYEICDYVI
jgi:hypothetical protein